MPKPKTIIAFSDVLALPAGTRESPVWVDDFYATVSNVRPGNGWTDFTLSVGADSIAGSAQDRDMTPFDGKECLFSGSMVKGEYQRVSKISVFRKCIIRPAATAADRAPAPRPIPATPAPQGGPVNGATVGFAMKEAIGLHASVYEADDLARAIQDPVWWAKIESTASRIIAISRGLEQGKSPAKAVAAGSHPELESEEPPF